MNGLIGPHPNVWTLFAFVNITIALAAGFGVLLGVSQVMLDQAAWGLWSVPVALMLLLGTYVASQFGQRLAADQSHALLELVTETLDAPLE